MRWIRLTQESFAVVALLSLALWATAAAGQDTAQADFQRGYFLQTHEGDLKGAIAAFEKAIADEKTPAGLKAEATTRLSQCREDLATADFAQLMPPDSLAYVEVTRPGQHVTQLLSMLGLVREGGAPAIEGKPAGTPLGGGLFFPDDFAVSPALTQELSKMRGVAIGISAIELERQQPAAGLVVLHPGDCDLLRGKLETAVQLLAPADPIEGFRTYCVEGKLWITLTSRLVMLCESRESLVAAVGRLKKPGGESLAQREDFKRTEPMRKGALMFAYAHGPRLMQQFGQHLRGQEADIARTTLDLEHLESLTLKIGTTEKSLQGELSLNMMPGQRNLVYGLIRTAPLNRQSLGYVPRDAAGVVLLGLNPASPGAPPTEKDAPPSFSAMDIGREVFGNIEELALFAAPPKGEKPRPSPLPEVGLVIVVKDPAKSEMLWNQLLALPTLIGDPNIARPQDTTIEGQPAKVYKFDPDAPPVAVTRLKDRGLVIGTEAAVAAAIRAGNTAGGLAQEPAFKPLLDRLGPDSSKAILLDMGRFAQTAAASGAMHVPPQEMAMIMGAVKDLKISAVTQEGPTQFAVRLEVTGLPNVPQIVKMGAPALHGMGARSVRVQDRRARMDRSVRSAAPGQGASTSPDRGGASTSAAGPGVSEAVGPVPAGKTTDTRSAADSSPGTQPVLPTKPERESH